MPFPHKARSPPPLAGVRNRNDSVQFGDKRERNAPARRAPWISLACCQNAREPRSQRKDEFPTARSLWISFLPSDLEEAEPLLYSVRKLVTIFGVTRCIATKNKTKTRSKAPFKRFKLEKHASGKAIMALDFLAGCVGGAAGVLVGHPFDTVKVRLQVQNVEKPLYRGTVHCFQSIIKQESALGLYKGIGSPMMGLTFINALVFGVQGNALRALGKDTPLHQFLAGSAAGAIQCVICCPMELAKTRMQLQGTGEYKLKSKNYKNSLDCLVKIYRKEGLKGINKGMVSTFLRETPSFGFYFLTYDCLTRYLGCEAEDSYIVPKLLLAGGMSGIVSWLSTYPVDVIKSRLQADGVGGVVRASSILLSTHIKEAPVGEQRHQCDEPCGILPREVAPVRCAMWHAAADHRRPGYSSPKLNFLETAQRKKLRLYSVEYGQRNGKQQEPLTSLVEFRVGESKEGQVYGPKFEPIDVAEKVIRGSAGRSGSRGALRVSAEGKKTLLLLANNSEAWS
ncbi:mitochondrial basic amino acids transporter [Crotalus adamanteus]|uniref:Mitochondrial basic amino acids transporter n=1 Tax=Crotalus adamanteus TaxID=8729 RepID=A0AAW1C4E4_CROAD